MAMLGQGPDYMSTNVPSASCDQDLQRDFLKTASFPLLF